MVRIAIDATALHGRRTGIGVFSEQILDRLADRDDLEVVAFAVTFRGRGQLGSLVPGGVRAIGRPMAARPLRYCWERAELPPIEWFIGSTDVVHGPNFVVPPTRRAARLATVHDLTPWRFPELANHDTRSYPRLIARAVDHGAWVHAVSDFVAEEIRDLFPGAADRVVVVPNGVSPLPTPGPCTDAVRGAVLAGGPRYVLALGTIEPRKDFPTLVAAFDAAAAADPDVRLVIAGPDGWGTDAFAAAVDRSKARDRIVRLGWVRDDDRAALLRGATVFAYPSLYEGFGLPPLEAMLAGSPVLATRVGALPEVVGDAAEWVDPYDLDALTSGLMRLLVDGDRRAELVALGTEQVARYSWETTAEGLAALYRRISS